MKIKRKKLILMISSIAAVLIVLDLWSVLYGNRHPQTGFGRLKSFVSRNILRTPETSDIIFLGDSITARTDWNGLFGVSDIMNAGISGNTTDDILARLDTLIALKPKKIFLMIGINDLAQGKTVSHVLENCKTIADKIKAGSPDTRLYVESVLPIDNDSSPIGTVDSREIVELNHDLEILSENEGAIFIDLYPSFQSQNSSMQVKLASDGVHPNAKGYDLLKILLEPYVK